MGRRARDGPAYTRRMVVTVRLLEAAETHELRRLVLRGGLEDAVVAYPADDEPATWHLGAVDEEGAVVATSTFFPEPCPLRPEVDDAFRLRSMAVAATMQGRGVGALVLGRAVERLREAGVALVWANARDSALGFYARLGFEVSDRSFVDPDSGLDHTVVVRLLG